MVVVSTSKHGARVPEHARTPTAPTRDSVRRQLAERALDSALSPQGLRAALLAQPDSDPITTLRAHMRAALDEYAARLADTGPGPRIR